MNLEEIEGLTEEQINELYDEVIELSSGYYYKWSVNCDEGNPRNTWVQEWWGYTDNCNPSARFYTSPTVGRRVVDSGNNNVVTQNCTKTLSGYAWITCVAR